MNKLILPICALAFSTTLPTPVAASINNNGKPMEQAKGVYTKRAKTPITATEVEKKVKKIISDCLGVEEKKLTLKTKFVEDLGADSLDVIEIIMEIEKEFNIVIPDEDAENIQTVKDVVIYVKGMVDLKR